MVQPTEHSSTSDLEHLMFRTQMVKECRNFFDRSQFIEVEPALLQYSPGNEAHLHAFQTRWFDLNGTAHECYLGTSPEYSCKKLLSKGVPKLYTLSKAFRNREQSPIHAPEFTMLEWYNNESTYLDLMQDCESLLHHLFTTLNVTQLRYKHTVLDTSKTFKRMRVKEAFSTFIGLQLDQTISDHGVPDSAKLYNAAQAYHYRLKTDDSWENLFSTLMTNAIEPHLGIECPVILYDYPECVSPFSKSIADQPGWAERFELYIAGIELANGCSELCDPILQEHRLKAQMDLKATLYNERYPIDPALLNALTSIRHAAGVALGFDRLLMLCLGASHISEVQWNPFLE